MRFFRKAAYYVQSIVRILFGFEKGLCLLPLLLNRSSTKKHTVRLKRPPVQLAIRGAMDLWAVKETFLDQFYCRYGVPVQAGWTVVDIGAGFGDFSILSAIQNRTGRIMAIEPYPESYQLLTENLTHNHIINVEPLPYAIWHSTGRVMLNMSGGEPLQIISQTAHKQPEGEHLFEVNALTLSDLMSQHTIPEIDLLKLDCEGAEYDILMSSPAETLCKVFRIVMEVHAMGGDRSPARMMDFLESAGYTTVWHPNIVHQTLGYLYAQRQDLPGDLPPVKN